MLVVDASVLAPAIAGAGEDGARFRRRLRGEAIAGPDLLRIEVMSVVRRRTHAAALTQGQADAAIEDLLELPMSIFPTGPLLPRAWDLRHNVTPYDGCYVALAEVVDGSLLTADLRLAHATGPRCPIEVP